MQIHLVFYVSLLKPYILNILSNWVEEAPPLIEWVTEEGLNEQKWEVEEILKSHVHCRKLQYYIKWWGYIGADT